MPAPDLRFALSLPPKKAIEWLESKKVTAESYRNLTASEIAKVYTIARMTDLDMLNDIKTSMVESAKSGQSFDDWRKGILNLLSNKGWLHPNGHNGKDIIGPSHRRGIRFAAEVGDDLPYQHANCLQRRSISRIYGKY